MRSMILGSLLLLSGCDALNGEPAGGEEEEALTAVGDAPVVAVDWLGRGTLYAAEVVARRGELTRVEYADGDNEWVDESRIQPWPDLTGRRVQVHTGARLLNVTVEEVRDGMFRVALDEGATTWFSADMLYRLDAPAPTGGGGGGGGSRRFPARAAAPAADVTVGRAVLAYWISGGELQRSRPWRARVTARNGDTVRLSYMDGSVAELPIEAVLRVFDDVDIQPAAGGRYWLDGELPAGTLLERRGELLKLRVGDGERWLEGVGVLATAPRVDATRLAPGALVTALWQGTSLYHGTVVSLSGETVTLAWHDGSDPSAVPVSDVLEIWEPSGDATFEMPTPARREGVVPLPG